MCHWHSLNCLSCYSGIRPTVTPQGYIWNLGDVGVGLMAWLNIVWQLSPFFFMRKPTMKALRDYEQAKKPSWCNWSTPLPETPLYQKAQSSWEKTLRQSNKAKKQTSNLYPFLYWKVRYLIKTGNKKGSAWKRLILYIANSSHCSLPIRTLNWPKKKAATSA